MVCLHSLTVSELDTIAVTTLCKLFTPVGAIPQFADDQRCAELGILGPHP